jgi:alpha/beta superfamily hydrolase
MDTSNFEACVVLQAKLLASFEPDVLVGSSFGGAVAVALLQRGLWKGPTLLLAQAAVRYGLSPELPAETRVRVVHGSRDTLIDLNDSRALAGSGTPGLTEFVEVDDDHALHASVENGALVTWVRSLGRSVAEG